MKHSPLLTFLLSAGALAAVSMMDWSSMCHPSKEAQATQDQIRHAGEAKMASLDPKPMPRLEVALEELTWQALSDVEFTDVYLEELDAYYWMPAFGAAVLASEGKDFYITGYMIPVDVDEDFYVLSRYPFANCFFCGGAGPESVVDLRFPDKGERSYQTDDRLTFKGTLRLNSDDVYQMNYILEGAVEHTP
jgi:hypothetical protein